ncbi:MAG: hypothetical protein ACSLFK_03435, partial [Gemmatimonadaceae bacterium]
MFGPRLVLRGLYAGRLLLAAGLYAGSLAGGVGTTESAPSILGVMLAAAILFTAASWLWTEVRRREPGK